MCAGEGAVDHLWVRCEEVVEGVGADRLTSIGSFIHGAEQRLVVRCPGELQRLIRGPGEGQSLVGEESEQVPEPDRVAVVPGIELDGAHGVMLAHRAAG